MAKKTGGPRTPTIPDRQLALSLLQRHWETVLQDEALQPGPDVLALINSPLVTIRYCLPTQLLGKLADPSLDALCLQARDKAPGLWDPRGFAAEVVAPWVLRNQKVLGNSADPYVGNPLRRPRLDEGSDQLSSGDQWNLLVSFLADVQFRNDPGYTETRFISMLAAIRDRMRAQDFSYVVPQRVSLTQADNLVQQFLSEKSGGDRGLAVAAALFVAFRQHFNIYHDVRRGVINASDASTGSVADLECLGMAGEVVLAVEVKERRITKDDVQVAIAKARAANLREFILITEGIVQADLPSVAEALAKAWASGTNIYHVTVGQLMNGALPILGEVSITDFIVQVGQQLNQFSTQPRHRRAWKDLLDTL